jgi:hypothetical protein
MSVTESALTDQVTRTAVEQFDGLRTFGSTLAVLLAGSVRATAFWVATLLPLSYPPLLVAGVTADHPVAFAALLSVNALAFVLGHAHRRDGAPDTGPAVTER